MNCAVRVSQDLTSIESLKKQYPKCFEGLGKFPDTCTLILNEDAHPVIHPPRRPPIQLRERIKQELERMTELEVIKPVEEPSDWVSSIADVTKANGSLRICIDLRDLNKALKRGQHYIPTVEEIRHKFAGAKFFSKLDTKSGYWSVPLDSKSQLLTTFNTPFGRYCFRRLPFGLRVSQDVFQAAMDKILQGLDGVISIADDISVVGHDEKEHDKNLHALFKCAQERGMVFNAEKCQIKTPEIMFFGNIYTKDGIRPDPAKIQAISDMSSPTSRSQLQSFLGLITYLSSYIPKLSEHTAALRKLLHKDSIFK